MTAETRPDLNLPEQLTLALKLLAESEGRLSLMEERLPTQEVATKEEPQIDGLNKGVT